jgi:hypothetical protein
MQRSFATPSRAASGPAGYDSVEGRQCERCRRLTALLLFPNLDARPGPWVLFLTAVCSFVAIRALELAQF